MEEPKDVKEIQHIVRQTTGLVVRGGGTKSALSIPNGDTAVLSTKALTGLLAYEPDEYTFTANAGTAVSQIAAALSKNGQYLPFDPLWVEKGATLGGTVAANLSGSGRYRYGGVRDFILGVTFVDGQGQLVRGGGQVVKNSAGFDLPKLMVGSLGRYGVLVTLTFKVFPRPHSYLSLQLNYPNLNAALHAVFKLAVMPFEMDVLDLVPQDKGGAALVMRLGGLPDALNERVTRLRDFLQSNTAVETAELNRSDDAYWQAQNRFDWVEPGHTLVKVPVSPKQIPDLDLQITQTRRRYTAGGGTAWIATTDTAALHNTLTNLSLVGLQLTGTAGSPFLGQRKGMLLAQRVKQALDPTHTFLSEP